MPVFPVRELSAQGIIKDTAPYDLPLNAWSGGNNVRFVNDRAERSPIFREACNLTTTLANGAGLVVFQPSSGFPLTFAVDNTGRVGQFTPSLGLTDVSDVGFTGVSGTSQFTSCSLGNLLYLNRETHTPRYWSSTSTAWAAIPNWDSTWRANVLRSFRDFLVAFAVTKGATSYGTMVKWSDATLYGSAPGSWDATVTTNLAGENPLTQMDSDIIDANNLRDVMMIYGRTQAWVMSYTGDKTYPMAFAKVMDGIGAISRNCAVEAEGKHYVFGPTDLWVTDGSQKESIATGKVRDWVFSSMNKSLSSRCFVFHNTVSGEIGFAFPSDDADAAFKTTAGCNRAVMFNYRNNTFGIVDLPCASACAVSNANFAYTWATAPSTMTWDNAGGSWADQGDNFKPAPFFVGNADGGFLTAPRLYALDPMDVGTRVSLPASAEANKGAYLERVGIDLDEANIPLSNFKLVRAINPQMVIFRSVPVSLQIGAAPTPASLPSYSQSMSFDPSSQYQLNVRANGRYLSAKISVDASSDFQVSGFDLDVVGGGRR